MPRAAARHGGVGRERAFDRDAAGGPQNETTSTHGGLLFYAGEW
jgi:hypothetical protein